MSEYEVKLILSITADDEVDAVSTFIEALVTKGLRDWKYKVIDEQGNESLLWGSTLEEVTREELLRDIDAGTDFHEEDEPVADVEAAFEAGEKGVTAAPIDDEGAALALAEELVRQDAAADSEE